MQNTHGLQRYIPELIARQVRQRCGFGCAICGSALITYHHFDPPFFDAREHTPDGITLLCPTHHTKAGSGLISAAAVAAANASPCCRQSGFARDWVTFDQAPVRVGLGSLDLYCDYPVVLDDEPIIWFEPPEEAGAPPRLNATFTDERHNVMFQLVRNEWRVGVDNYDVTFKGNRISIRRRRGTISFLAEASSDKGLTLRRLRMLYKGHRIAVRDDVMKVVSSAHLTTYVAHGQVNAQVGVLLRSTGVIQFGGNKPLSGAAMETALRFAKIPTREMLQGRVYILYRGPKVGDTEPVVPVAARSRRNGWMPYTPAFTSLKRMDWKGFGASGPDSVRRIPLDGLLSSLPPTMGLWINPYSKDGATTFLRPHEIAALSPLIEECLPAR